MTRLSRRCKVCHCLRQTRRVCARERKRRSNPSSIWRCRTMDCFAEPVIGRAFARPVGRQWRRRAV